MLNICATNWKWSLFDLSVDRSVQIFNLKAKQMTYLSGLVVIYDYFASVLHSVGNKSLVFFSTMCTVSVFAVQNIHKHEQVTKIEVAVTL